MKRKNSIDSQLCNELRATKTRFYCLPTQGLFNFRCFDNCVQYAADNKDKNFKIFECIYINDKFPVLHYVVQDIDTQLYHEVTLGWHAEHLEYYMIREVPRQDWPNLGNIFEKSLNYWLYRYTNWFDRNILKIDRVL